jgi:capsular polysaccharide biosynthesis protein
VEDSAHRYEVTLAVLEFFYRYLRTGDYIVIEDGIVTFLPEDIYRQFEDGPNRAVGKFLATHPGDYEIDRTLCDFYGSNVTYNTNGWLRRIRDNGGRSSEEGHCALDAELLSGAEEFIMATDQNTLPTPQTRARPEERFLHRGLNYVAFLEQLHAIVNPKSYFEIGVGTGLSLAVAKCPSVAVDPTIKPSTKFIGAKKECHLYQMTSDEFFKFIDLKRIFPDGINLAFLDGLHWYEVLLRDFINTEKLCHSNSVIALHDCLPFLNEMTGRVPNTQDRLRPEYRHFWAGDVWKTLVLIKSNRPDLQIISLDCAPTGLVLITNLDSSSKVLSERYDSLVAGLADVGLEDFGVERLFALSNLRSSKELVNPAVLRSEFLEDGNLIDRQRRGLGQELRFVWLEEILSRTSNLPVVGDDATWSALDGDLHYERAIADRSGVTCDSLIETNEVCFEIRERYLSVHNGSAISVGLFSLHNFGYLGPWSLPVHVRAGICLIGHSLNWTDKLATSYLQKSRFLSAGAHTAVQNSDAFSLQIGDQDVGWLEGKALILSSPGQGVYGHWLLDLVPRLYLTATTGVADIPIYLNTLPAWAGVFFESFSLDPAKVRRFPHELTFVPEAVVPSATKIGYTVARRVVSDAWEQLRGYLQKLAPPRKGSARRLFISRSRLPTNIRTVTNIGEVEDRVRRRGYDVVHPQEHSVAEQSRLFAEARIVIGEDGSALHNIIFSAPGAIVLVLSVPGRMNLWHLGICETMGHKVTYLYAKPDQAGGASVDCEILDAVISEIERHATM